MCPLACVWPVSGLEPIKRSSLKGNMAYTWTQPQRPICLQPQLGEIAPDEWNFKYYLCPNELIICHFSWHAVDQNVRFWKSWTNLRALKKCWSLQPESTRLSSVVFLNGLYHLAMLLWSISWKHCEPARLAICVLYHRDTILRCCARHFTQVTTVCQRSGHDK